MGGADHRHGRKRAHSAGSPILSLQLLLSVMIVAVVSSLPTADAAVKPSDVHVRSYTLDLLPPAVAPPNPNAVPAQIPGAIVQPPSTVQLDTAPSLGPQPPSPNVFLVIGVKTRALRGAEARRAIRETWAARASTQPLGVRVVFLGCEPDLSVLTTERIAEARDAIATEKATHQDFWTGELQCQDSFFTLVDKTVAFFDMALQTFPSLAYAMVVDDDVYVRMDRLVALLQSDRIPSERFYGGNTGEVKQRMPTPPIRNPESRYYLPTDMYPIDELPPFNAGSHYMLSKDVVAFIARNRQELRGLKGLDDVTMALWMLSLGIRPVFLPEFQIVRAWNCTEELISYADMSPTAIQAVHSNLVLDRPFCAGFDPTKWLKSYETVTFNFDDDDDEAEDKGDVQFHWDIELDPDSSRLRILTDITIARESIQLLYFPASAPYSAAFCNHVLPLLEAKLSILVGTNFCRLHRKILLRFLKGHDVSMPSLRPLLTLARHNLERDAIDDAANVTKHVLLVRLVAPQENRAAVVVLVECLMTAVHADKHIVVVSEDDPKHAPSVVVAVIDAVSDSADSAAVDSLAHQYNNPRTKLLVLSADGRRLSALDSDPRVVLITSDRTTTHARHLYLPQVSVVLANAMRYSPMALLFPVESSAPQPRSFAVFHDTHCGGTHQRTVLELLKEVDTFGTCNEQASETTKPSQTPTDDQIDRYGRYKFVVVIEDDAAIAPGYVSEGIAMAFLAGSIPIYVGHSETVVQLFNPKAFIDCGQFRTPSECVDYVHEVHHSRALYEAMWRELPVVNETAFVEAFSWHPQVADMVSPSDDYDSVLVGNRLQLLLQDS